MLISCGVFFLQRSFMLFLPPPGLWDSSYLCCFLLCFHISFSAPPPPPASSSPRHKLVFLSLPPIPISFSPPTILSSPLASIPPHTLPNQTSSPSICSVFNFPLRLTANSTCVNISAVLAHLFVHLVMRLEVCVTDLFPAGGAFASLRYRPTCAIVAMRKLPR